MGVLLLSQLDGAPYRMERKSKIMVLPKMYGGHERGYRMKIRKIFGSLLKGYKQKLPVTLGHDARTGIMIYPNPKTGGKTMMVVGLNKELPPGGRDIKDEDVDWMFPAFHFSDVRTMEITAKALTEMTAIWKEELEKETKGGQDVRKE